MRFLGERVEAGETRFLGRRVEVGETRFLGRHVGMEAVFLWGRADARLMAPAEHQRDVGGRRCGAKQGRCPCTLQGRCP